MSAVDPKIPFTVCRCSSQDDEHPATELNVMSPHTNGWQSQRFSEYPQELVLQLHQPARVRQIQILSHHANIAQRIELFVGTGPNNNPDAARFEKLGYISLDSNERSRFEARELKTVQVDASAPGTAARLRQPCSSRSVP